MRSAVPASCMAGKDLVEPSGPVRSCADDAAHAVDVWQEDEMMNFHPKSEAFWEPVFQALAGALIGALVGAAIGKLLGKGDLVGYALVPATVFGALVWLYDHGVWMEILRKSYGPDVIALPPVEEVEEPDYPRMIQCQENPAAMHVIDTECPLAWRDLEHFVIEVRNGAGMGYRRWVGGGEDQWATNDKYRTFLTWMFERGWAGKGLQDEAKLSEAGKCLFDDVVRGSFRSYPSPTDLK